MDNNSALTYIIYFLMKENYDYEGSRWEDKTEALKILESAKLEYYRQIIAPYEDKKIEENGDI